MLDKNILKNCINKCASKPGIYKMIGENGQILYIGKAKNLKNRLKQYQNFNGLSKKILNVLSKLKKLETIITETEVEALLLEAKLVKKHQPRYNALLKDDKSFPYVCIEGKAKFPRIFTHRGPLDPSNHYYGPFTSSKIAKQVICTLQDLFSIGSCGSSFKSLKRPCIFYQMGKCAGVCIGEITEKEYKKRIKLAKNFLTDRVKTSSSKLATSG